MVVILDKRKVLPYLCPINHTKKMKIMANVTALNANFKVVTPQKYGDRIVNIQGATGLNVANFYFVTHDGNRVEVAEYNAETKELNEKISGIVSII